MSELPHARSERHLPSGAFYGAVVRSAACLSLRLSELRHEHPRTLPEHCHELAFFCLLLDGEYSEQFGHRAIRYRPFTVGFHPPEMVHRDEIGERGGRFFCVEVGKEWLNRLSEDGPSVATRPDLHGGELAWLSLRLYREFRALDECSGLAIESLVLEMLVGATGARLAPELRPPPWLGRAKDFLHDGFSRRLRLDEVALVAAVHPVHLARVFRRYERRTLGEYVRRLRVQFACNELVNSERSLAEIALAAGFSDQSHFTRAFKRVTGVPPGAFRACMRRM